MSLTMKCIAYQGPGSLGQRRKLSLRNTGHNYSRGEIALLPLRREQHFGLISEELHFSHLLDSVLCGTEVFPGFLDQEY